LNGGEGVNSQILYAFYCSLNPGNGLEILTSLALRKIPHRAYPDDWSGYYKGWMGAIDSRLDLGSNTEEETGRLMQPKHRLEI